MLEAKGVQVLISNGETLDLVKGDKIKVIDVLPPQSPEIIVNFKGFVGNKTNNTGEDRGYEIDTATDLLRRYSLHGKGELYRIIASRDDDIIGQIKIRFASPRLDYLVLRVNDHRHVLLRSEDIVSLALQDKICLEEIQTNLFNKSGIHLNINGHRVRQGELWSLKELCVSTNNQFDIRKGPLVLGRVFINTINP